MTKTSSPSRIIISGNDLESIARCPKSFSYLGRIQVNTTCKRCYAFSQVGCYVLQRSFRGLHFPSIKRLTELYALSLGDGKLDSWSLQDAKEQYSTLDHLRDWGRGVWDKIDVVNAKAESHFGFFTVTQLIDAVLCIDGIYTLVYFSCNSKHQEQVMNYKVFHGSYWLRESFRAPRNNIMIIRLTPHGPEFHVQAVEFTTELLETTITNILSRVTPKDWETVDEYEKMLENLVPIPGEHCYNCMACFNINTKEKEISNAIY